MAEIFFTAEPEANALLADNSFALLVGLVLYQQVPVEKAFAGPYVLAGRIDEPLEAATVAAMDPTALEEVFRAKPAIHRFPANMAKRTHGVARHVVDRLDGEPEHLWDDGADGATVLGRMKELPGFGDYKARVYLGVLAAHFGVRPLGIEGLVPDWPSIADVTSAADLAELKARKKAWKESQS